MLAAGVPVVASAIPGSTGLLGDDHTGYFCIGDTAEPAARLFAAETAAGFYKQLLDRRAAMRPLAGRRGRRC